MTPCDLPPIRPLDGCSDVEIKLVAARMRQTLIEVLGEERGTAMYTMAWLEERVRWHLDPARSTAAVFVATEPSGALCGHTIVRLEQDEPQGTFGLFSTIYVIPGARRRGHASRLLQRGEAWLRARGVPIVATYTATSNDKLKTLFGRHGYEVVEQHTEMVRLVKPLD